MDATALTTALQDAIAGRLLLEHPFYQRWSAGTVSREELAAYASQYRAIEAELPHALEAIAAGLRGEARTSVEANLADERSNPAPHLDLFDQFAAAMGADRLPPTPATAALVDLYATAGARSGAYGLGVLVAYEIQAAAIADSKAEGLRTHYDVDAAGTAFWDVHATLELDHGSWVTSAMATLAEAELAEALAGVDASAAAWWGFLDERESSASALATR